MEICHSDKIQKILTLFNELPDNAKHDVFRILRTNMPIPPSTTKKRKFSDDFQTEAVTLWKSLRNYTLTAEKLNEKYSKEDMKIDESYVRRWVKEQLSEEEIKAILKKVKITKSKQRFPEMEDELMVWFKQERNKKVTVTGKRMKEKALEIFSDMKKRAEEGEKKLDKYKYGNFNGSNGWFRKFLKRKNVSRRIATHIASKMCENYSDEIIKFLGRIKKLR